MDDNNDKRVVFRYVSYHLPAWSVSILADYKTAVFNIAKMASETKGMKGLKWEVFVEKAGIWGEADFGFVDHINTTKVTTTCGIQLSIFVDENEEFLKKGSSPVLLIESKGHALHAFVNDELQENVVSILSRGR
ncbi:putative beta-galactosidase [Rosa chinensis]|uniref:Putative beta-galactosidase n=1 Tax=Rosa chinensis TaxID=74649 RepID=A0A2P6PW32_ROSCH|nr:putative beta-galactosidase [Rosa chinensis]